jgi:hypothetical protein
MNNPSTRFVPGKGNQFEHAVNFLLSGAFPFSLLAFSIVYNVLAIGSIAAQRKDQ